MCSISFSILRKKTALSSPVTVTSWDLYGPSRLFHRSPHRQVSRSLTPGPVLLGSSPSEKKNAQSESRCWFQIFFIFTPILGKMIQFDDHIFSDGLVQPPTRNPMERRKEMKSGILMGMMNVAAMLVDPPWIWKLGQRALRENGWCTKKGKGMRRR